MSGIRRCDKDILVIDDLMIIKLLSDLNFYEHVKTAEPLKNAVILYIAKFTRMRQTPKGIPPAQVRECYDSLINRFHSLVKPSDYDSIRAYLKEHKKTTANTLVFSESPL